MIGKNHLNTHNPRRLIKSMKRQLFIISIAVFFFSSLSCQAQETRVSRQDCGVSFVEPRGFRHIYVESPELSDNSTCLIAFVRNSNKNNSSSQVGQPEGWRELVDYYLYVKRESLQNSAHRVGISLDQRNEVKIISNNSSNQPKFKVKEFLEIPISNGKFISIETTAITPTPSMKRLGTTGQLIFIAGNSEKSIEFSQWISIKNKNTVEDGRAFFDTFKSIEFNQ